jgi:hypothetical protein
MRILDFWILAPPSLQMQPPIRWGFPHETGCRCSRKAEEIVRKAPRDRASVSVECRTISDGGSGGSSIIGGIFFSVLGGGQDIASHVHAFAVALSCNVALLAVGGLLSLWLPRQVQ